MPIVRPQTHGWRLCQRTGGVVASLAQFFVYHVNAITVILNHFKIVDDGLHVLFFFYLLVDEPLQHALSGIIILFGGEGEKFVDAFGDALFVAQRAFEHVENAIPLGGNGFDGAKVYLPLREIT